MDSDGSISRKPTADDREAHREKINIDDGRSLSDIQNVLRQTHEFFTYVGDHAGLILGAQVTITARYCTFKSKLKAWGASEIHPILGDGGHPARPRKDKSDRSISLETEGGEWCKVPRMAHDRGSLDWELDELESMKLPVCCSLSFLSTCRPRSIPPFRRRILDAYLPRPTTV